MLVNGHGFLSLYVFELVSCLCFVLMLGPFLWLNVPQLLLYLLGLGFQ